MARHRLADGHVDLVHVGPLLAVHLHADECVVEQCGDLSVLERLVGHHVAPVARRVADGEEDGLALPVREREGVVAPRVPVHGVVGVLA
ncbi:MAG: hypothetical protein AAGN64_04500 [Bacteroidota bacterium]